MVSWCLGVFLLAALASAQQNYKLCVLPRTLSYYSAAQICEKLEPTPVRCVFAVDRLGCMNKIATGDADFAVFDAEDLLIAANNKSLSDLLVTHRVHATENEKWEFGVAAVVSNKAKISKLSDLKNKKLCHPGNDPFAANYDWSEVFSLYFEDRVAPQSCHKNLSVEENRVKSLAEFFGESCKPGLWASDPDVDHKLKKKYASLCGLCDVPSVCSERDKYWGRQGALYCLSDCLGDVAWSMLKDIKYHFGAGDVSVCSDVSLLCPDGSMMPINATDPCIWVSRPLPVIATKRTKAEEIQKMLKETLEKADTPDDFINLLESNTFTQPRKLTPSIPPQDYLATAPGYLSANSKSTCGQNSRRVNLCIGSLEDKIKCDWLAAVTQAYGIQPTLNCVYGADCLVSVANKTADVTITTTDQLLPALRDNKLKPLLVHLPIHLKKAKTVSAVVKSNSRIKHLSDLKGKKACFPSMDGMGWTSFAMYLKKNEAFSKFCPYAKGISKFFSEICISDPNPSVAEYSNMKICNVKFSGNRNSWFDQEGSQDWQYDNDYVAFQCLAIGGADVAFISLDAIPKYLNEIKDNPEAEGLSITSFRPVCDGDSQTLDCHLSWSSYSQVLVNEKISPSREEDIRALFTGLNNLFAHSNTPSTRTFNMFDPANTLFYSLDPTEISATQQELEQIDDFLKKAKSRPKNYELSVDSMTKCSPSSASLFHNQLFITVLAIFMLFNLH